MKTTASLRGEPGRKSALLRARCQIELKTLTKKAAEILSLDESDVIRIGTQKYAASVVYRDPMAHA
ncbi:MAG TPA: hypothetical protein VGI59_09550 [Candidatus Udaeobacter sp.]|jgi:hypothetical protein